ncbi:MAG: 5-dehydro-4-deoxy-D-glucuronate isomerase, partial [Rhodobacteraceae bacterium]|nr:5-dehydro-4-deoxy-D-glucuronate isomerase [Paracoccaceae bacterium]
MLTVETRHLPAPEAARRLDTGELRRAFALEGLFRPGAIALVCTHLDRLIAGGAMPGAEPLELAHVAETGTPGFLDRREAVIVALDAGGTVHADGTAHAMAAMDMLYLGTGTGALRFEGAGVRFYILSAPAHRALPARLVRPEDARRVDLGSAETANRRTINQCLHPEVLETCQLLAGFTTLHAGSVWNTMPAHTHDRRSEIYLYTGIAATDRVLHLMGEPDQT